MTQTESRTTHEDLPSEASILAAITRAASRDFRSQRPKAVFEGLLADLLQLTNSAFGYIGELLFDDNGDPYLYSWAHTDLSWNEETRAVFSQSFERQVGLEFRNLDSLFGWSMRHQAILLTNDPENDPRARFVPDGPPPPRSYLALPLMRNGTQIGQMGIGNRPGGFSEALIAALEPFTTVVAHLVETFRTDQERERAMEVLRSEQEWSSAILSSLNDFITIHDPDGTMTYLGAAAERTLSPADAEKFREGELLHPDDLPRVLDAIVEVANHQRGPSEPAEFRIRDARGGYRVLEASGQDLRATPTIGGILVISRDITERRLAEAQRRESASLLASLVDALPDGVLFLDQFGNVEFANQPLCALIGISLLPEDIVGQNLFKDFQGELARLFDSQIDVIDVIVNGIEEFHRQGIPQSVEISPVGGNIIECVYRSANLLTGEPGHLWLLRDVTERRRATERRHQLLAQERELRRAVEATNRSLVDLAELKNAFVATVAHELRTPLTSVVSFTELLLDDGEAFSGEHQEFLATIHRNANRLLYLVGDLLLLAQMESGGYELDSSPVDLAQLIRDVATSLAPQAATSFIVLDVETESGPPISLDVLRMEQVLLNILSNAIKFIELGGRVTVRSWFDGNSWTVSVQDSGIGIPEGEQDRLFQRFFRATNTVAARIPGTGLGLVISRVIVELHGGDISLESILGEGTTVTIVLPLTASTTSPSDTLMNGESDD